MAITIKHKPEKQIHEIHIIFDNALEINDKTKVKEIEAEIAQVITQIKKSIKDINRTPLK